MNNGIRIPKSGAFQNLVETKQRNYGTHPFHSFPFTSTKCHLKIKVIDEIKRTLFWVDADNTWGWYMNDWSWTKDISSFVITVHDQEFNFGFLME